MTDFTRLSGPATDTRIAPDRRTGAYPAPPVITEDDPRFASMLRGMNHRFTCRPDYVCVVTTTEQVIDAVNKAVTAGRRVTARSGGHCFEDLAASADVNVLLDMSEMTQVYYDAAQRAFAVEPGATLGHVYRVLFKGWNVTIPGGECPEVGAGGHFAGGGYGPLSRQYGSIVDYLAAVEVVVVDEGGTARAVVATSDPDDPHRDLWWAHTGGGGGNFGVVTRYWLRTPGATSTDPADLLPRAPTTVHIGHLIWLWDSMTEEAFGKILRNFSSWFEKNSGVDSPYTNLAAFLDTTGRAGHVRVGVSIDDATPDAEAMVSSFFAAITDGVDIQPANRALEPEPWLFTMTFPGHGDPRTELVRRVKIKSAYLRKGYTDRQIAVIYKYMASQDLLPALALVGYGAQVNKVAPDATATAQRDSVMKAVFLSSWANEEEDDASLGRIRELYRDVYAETGGVPVPNEVNDGSYINYPDADLADPEWNKSGVPWQTLYYKDNYPRLQQVKKRYDPRNVFRHRFSIELPQ